MERNSNNLVETFNPERYTTSLLLALVVQYNTKLNVCATALQHLVPGLNFHVNLCLRRKVQIGEDFKDNVDHDAHYRDPQYEHPTHRPCRQDVVGSERKPRKLTGAMAADQLVRG